MSYRTAQLSGAAFLIALTAGCTTPTAMTGDWALSLDGERGGSLAVLTVAPGEGGAASATVRNYASAPLGFEVELRERGTVENFRVESGRMHLTLPSRREPRSLDGTVRRGEISGSVSGTATRSFRAIRLSSGSNEAAGIYSDGVREFGLTRREYGGWRLIALTDGRNLSLLPTQRGQYVGFAPADRPGAHFGIRARFRRTGGGPTIRIAEAEGIRTLTRQRSFTEEAFSTRTGDGINIAGTLLVPENGARINPAIILVAGSGPIYRTALYERAVFFARLGFATLILDKRGTGGSGGQWRDDLWLLAEDLRAAVAELRNHPRVDAARIGVQGHSQAGSVIPLAAASNPQISFAIIVNGGGIDSGAQSLFDKENDLIREGYPPDVRSQALALMRRFFAYYRSGEGDHDALERDYLAATQARWFNATDLPRLPQLPLSNDTSPELARFRRELQYDPTGTEAGLTQPVLVLLGQNDQTVPASVVAERWRQALQHRPSASRVEILPGLTHSMREEQSDGSSRLAPAYLEAMRRWLTEIVPGTPRPAAR